MNKPNASDLSVVSLLHWRQGKSQAEWLRTARSANLKKTRSRGLSTWREYFLANEIKDETKMRAILLNVYGSKTYGLLRDILQPHKPAETEFTNIVKELEKHYHPKPSEIVERFKFHSRLRKLSEHCNFGKSLKGMLRDRLVCGINNDRIQRRLLAETDLKYKKAVEIALAIESTSKHVGDLYVSNVGMFPRKDRIDKVTYKQVTGKQGQECYFILFYLFYLEAFTTLNYILQTLITDTRARMRGQ